MMTLIHTAKKFTMATGLKNIDKGAHYTTIILLLQIKMIWSILVVNGGTDIVLTVLTPETNDNGNRNNNHLSRCE